MKGTRRYAELCISHRVGVNIHVYGRCGERGVTLIYTLAMVCVVEKQLCLLFLSRTLVGGSGKVLLSLINSHQPCR